MVPGKQWIVLVIAATLFVPLAAGASGGGTVSNRVPTVESFSNGAVATRAVLDTESFSGEVKDRNKEGDLVNGKIRIQTTSGPSVVSERTITSTDVSTAADPGFGGDGWKVWNPTANDGLLTYVFQRTYPSSGAGAYVWEASVMDGDAGAVYQVFATTIGVTVSELIEVADDPVSAAGAAQAGANWGGWSGMPGAAALGTNYLKVTNTGTTATQEFMVDFTDTEFSGVTTSSEKIPIDAGSNIEFLWWEDTTPGVTAPNEVAIGSYTSAVSATGSVQPAFSATGAIIYVTYRVVSIPDPLIDQDYSATYTRGAV